MTVLIQTTMKKTKKFFEIEENDDNMINNNSLVLDTGIDIIDINDVNN